MSYERFAYLYDDLMADAPYDRWIQFLSGKLLQYKVESSDLLDLACGTGELSVRLAKQGFDVTGIDLSSEMLSVAQNKADKEGVSLRLFQQDMAELEGVGDFGIIGIFCDSLNYLKTEEEVKQTFKKVYEHLSDKGIFLFDVHSIHKMNNIFGNETYTLNDDHLSYIWNCFQGEYPNSVEHDLSFFVLDEKTGKYDRFDEVHFQRTFTVEQYSEWLKLAGFDLLEVTADFENNQPEEDSERIFFSVKKA